MDDIGRIRREVTSAYPGDEWKQKVAKMTDGQVQAVYLRLKRKGKCA